MVSICYSLMVLSGMRGVEWWSFLSCRTYVAHFKKTVVTLSLTSYSQYIRTKCWHWNNICSKVVWTKVVAKPPTPKLGRRWGGCDSNWSFCNVPFIDCRVLWRITGISNAVVSVRIKWVFRSRSTSRINTANQELKKLTQVRVYNNESFAVNQDTLRTSYNHHNYQL